MLRRATLNHDDRMSFCEDALAEVEKVKIALEQYQSYVDRWTTCTDSIDLQMSTIPEDISALSGEQLQARVFDLQQQLQVEERNISKTQLKLQETVEEFERCMDSATTCEKRYASLAKSQSYTKSYLILVGQYLVRLKTGLLDSISPTPIQRPKDSDKNTLVYVENCPLCGEGFHCNDIVVSSCGHTYHPFCMNNHSSKSNRCIAEFCDEDFDPNWCLSFGFAELTKHDSSPNVIHDSPCPGVMFLEIYTPNAIVLCFSISGNCILFFSFNWGAVLKAKTL